VKAHACYRNVSPGVSTMLFNSVPFLYFAVVVLLFLLIVKTRKYQYLFLLFASYFFYYFSSGPLVVLLLFSSLLDFFCGKAIHDSKSDKNRKWYLAVSLIGNLGVLAFFKYTNFAIKTTNMVASWFGNDPHLPLAHIILPIGISFFTFQTMSYTLDIYFRKLKPTDSFLRFALYVSFFPQLVAGPIIRASDLLPQLDKPITITQENFKHGMALVMWGLVKKMVIADNIAAFVNVFFADPTAYPGSIPIIVGAIAFTIQVYCDFSGYSDVAIGLARIMGFHFPLNFDKPFFSKTIAEFWKRWHISLSTWFRDYLFMPLMRKGFTKTRLYISVLIVYFTSGLWHGAGWNFVIWGTLHGVFLLIGMATRDWRQRLAVKTKLSSFPRFHNLIKTLFTLYLFVLSLLIFRLYDPSYILYAVKKFIFVDFSGWSAQLGSLLPQFQVPLFFVIVFMIIHTLTYFKRGFVSSVAQKGYFEWTIYLTGMCLLLYFFSPTQTVQFFYFQF